MDEITIFKYFIEYGDKVGGYILLLIYGSWMTLLNYRITNNITQNVASLKTDVNTLKAEVELLKKIVTNNNDNKQKIFKSIKK